MNRRSDRTTSWLVLVVAGAVVFASPVAGALLSWADVGEDEAQPAAATSAIEARRLRSEWLTSEWLRRTERAVKSAEGWRERCIQRLYTRDRPSLHGQRLVAA